MHAFYIVPNTYSLHQYRYTSKHMSLYNRQVEKHTKKEYTYSCGWM